MSYVIRALVEICNDVSILQDYLMDTMQTLIDVTHTFIAIVDDFILN